MGKKKRDSAADLSTRGVSAGGAQGEAVKRGKRRAYPPRRPKPPAVGIAGVPGSKNPERRCTATVRSTGERCKRAAIKGGNVCTSHGGAAPQVRKAAKDRLLELVDPALHALTAVLSDPGTDDPVKVRAALGILDRTGYGPGQTVTVHASAFDALVSDAVAIDRSGVAPSLPVGGGGGNPIGTEDYEQHATDEQTRQWATLDAEDEQPYATRLDPYDGNTVQGEVVRNHDDHGPFPPPPPTGPSEFGGDPPTRDASGSVPE